MEAYKENKITVKNSKISGKYLLINGKPTYLRSGEITYFRVKKKEWGERLKKAKEVGLICISTYIPWFWHEPEEGEFDFTGKTHPQRDLRSYLDLIADSGLYTFILN